MCRGLKFRFLDFKILLNENGWSGLGRDGTVLLSNPLSLSRSRYNIPAAALAWTNLSSLHFSGKSNRQCLLSFIESHIKPWLAFWWSHFISDEPNHSLHGNPNIFLEKCHFQSKTFDGYHKVEEKSLWLTLWRKKKMFPSRQVENQPFQLAAIICSKWEFWQIYAQWRLIVGDKCGFFATDHLWPSDAPPAVDHSKVQPCVCACQWLFSSVLHSALARVRPPGGLRQPLPVGGLRPGKHSKF